MRHFFIGLATVAAVGLAAFEPASARPSRSTSVYDGAWRLAFITRSGVCPPSYEFDVNIRQGIITHPNLVRFRGSVSRGGVARASVIVQNKSASGYGRLSGVSGKGSWSGFSGTDRCSGYWIAQKI